MSSKKEEALLVVDMQNDFLPGGALGVKGGDMIIPLINSMMEQFPLVVATQDWHPANHISFASRHGQKPGTVITINDYPQTLWPAHCMQHTIGAELTPDLRTELIEKIFYKGADSEIDSYSAFYDNLKLRETGQADFLRKKGVKKIFIAGLTLDYCIKYSALDARDLGFEVVVVVDATKPVNLMPGDGHEAIEVMISAGVDIQHTSDIIS